MDILFGCIFFIAASDFVSGVTGEKTSPPGCIEYNNGKINLFCGSGKEIKVESSVIITRQPPGHCTTEDCCSRPVLCRRELTASELEPYVTQCDGREQCEVNMTTHLYCSHERKYTDVQTITFECEKAEENIQAVEIKNISEQKCFGDRFGDTECKKDYFLEVVNAFYGVSSCYSTTCCPNNTICEASIKDENQEYYDQIIFNCNNRTKCVPFEARQIHLYNCTPVTATDYVQIDIKCVPKYRLTTEKKETEHDVATRLPTSHDPYSSQWTQSLVWEATTSIHASSSSAMRGAVIGGVVGCLILVIGIFLVACTLLIRKRSKKSSPPAKSDYIAPLYTLPRPGNNLYESITDDSLSDLPMTSKTSHYEEVNLNCQGNAEYDLEVRYNASSVSVYSVKAPHRSAADYLEVIGDNTPGIFEQSPNGCILTNPESELTVAKENQEADFKVREDNQEVVIVENDVYS